MPVVAEHGRDDVERVEADRGPRLRLEVLLQDLRQVGHPVQGGDLRLLRTVLDQTLQGSLLQRTRVLSLGSEAPADQLLSPRN